jgi:hypothetical protein
MATPARLTNIECPRCHKTKWIIDSDDRGASGVAQGYPERIYACGGCGRKGVGWSVRGQAPPELLLQPHELYPMTRADFDRWVEVLRESFPGHPRLAELGTRFFPCTPEDAAAARAAWEREGEPRPLRSEILERAPRPFEDVRPLLVQALQEARARLEERGVPVQLFGEQGSKGRCSLGAGISEAEAIRIDIGPGSTEQELSLSHLLVPNPLRRGFPLESREAHEQARQRRRAARLAAHAEALEDYDVRLKEHGKAERRRVLAAARGHALRVLGVLLVLASPLESYAIFYAWDLGAYYREVTHTYMGLLVIKAFALALPWLVILAPPLISGVVCFRLFDAAWSSRRDRVGSPLPVAPSEPEEEEKDGPFAVLDSVDLVKAYCMQVVSEVVARATR